MKKTVRHTQVSGHSAKRLIVMLALQLAFVFFGSGLHAQNFSSYPTNIEYGLNGGINQYKVPDDARFSSGSTTDDHDPVINLSMDCLAANGYGQWTCSRNIGALASITDHAWIFSPDQISGRSWDMSAATGIRKGWFLLGNLIGKPSEKYDATDETHHPGCQPPGIVSGGKFTSINPSLGCIVDANLAGSVRFIQVEPTGRATFLVEGLNDEHGTTPFVSGGTTGDQQIDISLAGTNPNPPQIVTQPTFSYTVISTGGHPVIPSSSTTLPFDPDFKDQFHHCIDQSYLYVTWVSYHGTTPNIKTEIWATVVDLFSGTVIVAPFQIASDNHNYMRPTIACDRRGAPSSPTFSVAFITDLTGASVGSYIGNTEVHGGYETFPLNYYDPFTAKPSTTYDTYTSATHARVLVSSVAGSTTSPIVAVYVRTNDDLLLFYPTWPTGGTVDHGNYVDGAQAHNSGTHYPPPMIITNYVNRIVDQFIVAFANPYDNQDLTNGYNQFHCLYQLDVSSPTETPLVLVRGNDGFCVYHTGGDTRLILNRDNSGILSDPTSYCGAVNQMGIHVHWRTSANDHFYVRDTRAFDEPIEENTLVTNVCVVANGTAHGGTNGALAPNKVTIWTDPNYGLINSDPTSGLYFKSNYTSTQYTTTPTPLNRLLNIGTLNFAGAGVALEPVHLYTAPNINITFNASNQKIVIGTATHGGTWDFYGTSQTNCFSNPSNGKVTLTGFHFETGTDSYGTLNIHPGGQFFGKVTFVANMGKINIQFGSNIFPLKTSGSNADATGLFLIDRYALLTSSKVNSFLPLLVSTVWNDDATDDIPILKIISSGQADTYSLNSVNTDYTNFNSSTATVAGGNPGVLEYAGDCGDNRQPNKVVFNGGTIKRERIFAFGTIDNGFEVKNMTLDQISADEIHIKGCANIYTDILDSNNTFLSIAKTSSGVTFMDMDNGIVIEGFNVSGRRGQVNVLDNKFNFTTNNPTSGEQLAESAIKFLNSTGNIIRNNISDHEYLAGITITSNAGANTFAYLCNNTVSGLNGAGLSVSGIGIVSDHYLGYVSLNQISNCNFGYRSKDKDKPAIVFSSITGSTFNGIDILGAISAEPAEVDLTGVHTSLTCTSGCINFAAFNTISGNATSSGAQVMLKDGNQMVDYGDLSNGNWTTWGHNNTLPSSASSLLVAIASGSVNINSVDRNWWGSGIDPFTLLPNPPVSAQFTVQYTATTGLVDGALNTGASDFSCSGYTSSQSIDPKGNMPLSLNPTQGFDTCAHLKLWRIDRPQTPEEAKLQYDTLRLFIERCATSDNESWRVFTSIDGAVQLYSEDTARFTLYRNWLISVLYLNTSNPQYFCVCMGSIAGTYQYGKYNPLGYLAVLSYLRNNHPECWGSGGDQMYSQDSLSDVHNGYDASHLPSLDSMGLGFLLHNSVVTSPSLSPPIQYIAFFTSSPNPFINETTLQFTLNRMTYTTIAVYDELGRLVWGDGRGSSLYAGMHQVHLDGKNLPSGTLYARISTGFGEVKTVKLVHEK